MRKILLASAATLGAMLVSAGAASAQPVKPVAAGTIVVHLNGYFEFDIGDIGSSSNSAAGYKINPVTTEGDARIYPGFDAKTISGISYGVQVETRIAASDATVAANAKTGAGSTTGTDAVYVKRAYGYIGTPVNGYARFGQSDSAFTLLQTGVVEAFGDTQGFNSTGGIESAVPGSAAPGNFVFADQSALYATDKVIYLTPAYTEPMLGGALSGAVGYEPNSNGLNEGYGDCGGTTATYSYCASEAASPTAGDIGKRRKNTIDAAVQYVLKANGFATKANIGYIHAVPIAYDGAAVATGALHYGYDSLSVLQAGAQTTYAGFTLGANIKGGQALDSYAFKVRGTRDAFAYILSGDYVVGPYVMGAYFFDNQTAGAYTPGAHMAHTLNEYGFATGANYVVGKDLSMFVEYLYGHRHQPGNTALSPTASASARNAQMQAISVGGLFKW